MNNGQDKEVQSLIKELEHLQLRIGAVNNRLSNLERNKNSEIRVKESRLKREQETTQDRATGCTGKHKCSFMIGDKIRVKNTT